MNQKIEENQEIDNEYRPRHHKFCFINSEKCNGKIIQAHSISDSFLRQIAENGEVYTYEKGKLDKVGLKKASTFKGFCGYHDNELFKCFENNGYDPSNPEHVFKISFRGFAKEFFTKLDAIHELVTKADNNKSNPKRYESLLLSALGHNLSFYRIVHLKSIFLNVLREKQFTFLDSISLCFDNSLSCFVSSVFYLEKDLNGGIVNDIRNFSYNNLDPLFLNIVPVGNSTIVTLSYCKNGKVANSNLINTITKLDINTQKKVITQLIILYIENFFVCPVLYDENIRAKKNSFKKAFENYFETGVGFEDINKYEDLKDFSFF